MEKPELLKVEGGGISKKRDKKGNEIRDSYQIFFKQGDFCFLGYLEKTSEKTNGESVETNGTIKCKQCARKVDGKYCGVRFPVRISASLSSPDFMNVANWEVVRSPKNDHARM